MTRKVENMRSILKVMERHAQRRLVYGSLQIYTSYGGDCRNQKAAGPKYTQDIPKTDPSGMSIIK